MSSAISLKKVISFVAIFAFSAVAAHYAQPLVHGNDTAINVIVTVFSILAGFLVAIIAVVGDPALLPPGSWRDVELERNRLNRRLNRHKTLFMAYLITLGLVFLSLLAAKSSPLVGSLIEKTYLCLGSIAFVYSLRLPGALIDTQRERIDSIIEQRRDRDNISNQP